MENFRSKLNKLLRKRTDILWDIVNEESKISGMRIRIKSLEQESPQDIQLQVLKGGLLELEKNLVILETKNNILKLEEKYLFKNITLYIAEMPAK